MDFVVMILRNICFWLDQIVYGFISTVYNLLYEITNTNIFSITIFKQFSAKIYTLVGIVMLFRVLVSILSYIVDPDALIDKSKGFNKIIGNVVTTFALFVLVPLVFNMALDFQNIILKSNFIGRLFMLDNFSSTNVLNPGDSMAYETLTAFYHFDTLTYPQCNGNPNEWDEECKTTLNGVGLSDEEYDNLKKYLVYGYELKNVNLYMNSNAMKTVDDNNNYVMAYLPLISTLAGGAVVLLLMVFCFDVAVRNVKLGFLQMLAPVPIISRIDPKKGKGVYDKWVKTCLTTYLDLFVRLLAINFAIFVISLLTSDATSGLSDVSEMSLMGKVFIILGVLLFAKELPNLIKDITGFDAKGTFTMNPLNKFRQVPLVGAAASTTLAMAGGAYTGYKAGKEAGHIGRGIIQGMAAAHGDIKGKVSWGGADGKSKASRAWHTGSNAGYKAITGKEFSQRTMLKDYKYKEGAKEIKALKDDRTIIQGKQAELNAELQSLYNQLQQYSKNSKEYNMIQNKIRNNRATNGLYDKHIRSIEDQISDIKRLYTIDESPKKDVESAQATARQLLKEKERVKASENGPLNGKYFNVYDKNGRALHITKNLTNSDQIINNNTTNNNQTLNNNTTNNNQTLNNNTMNNNQTLNNNTTNNNQTLNNNTMNNNRTTNNNQTLNNSTQGSRNFNSQNNNNSGAKKVTVHIKNKKGE